MVRGKLNSLTRAYRNCLLKRWFPSAISLLLWNRTLLLLISVSPKQSKLSSVWLLLKWFLGRRLSADGEFLVSNPTFSQGFACALWLLKNAEFLFVNIGRSVLIGNHKLPPFFIYCCGVLLRRSYTCIERSSCRCTAGFIPVWCFNLHSFVDIISKGTAVVRKWEHASWFRRIFLPVSLCFIWLFNTMHVVHE